MRRPRDVDRRSVARRLTLALAAGVLVHLLLFNAGKSDSDPPVCHSLVGYEVPCGNLSYAAAAVTTSLTAALLLGGTLAGPTRTRDPGSR